MICPFDRNLNSEFDGYKRYLPWRGERAAARVPWRTEFSPDEQLQETVLAFILRKTRLIANF